MVNMKVCFPISIPLVMSLIAVSKSRWPQNLVKGCVKPVEKVAIIHKIKSKHCNFKILKFNSLNLTVKIFKIPVQVLDDFTLTVPRDQWTGGTEVAGFTGSLEIYMKKYMDPCQAKIEKPLGRVLGTNTTFISRIF